MFTRVHNIRFHRGFLTHIISHMQKPTLSFVVDQNLSLHKKVLWCSALISHFRKGSFGTADESNVFPVRQADRGPLLTLNPAKIAIMKSSLVYAATA